MSEHFDIPEDFWEKIPKRPPNALNTTQEYIQKIQEKYPEETERDSINPKHYDLFPEHGIQVREVLEVLCNKLDAAYPVPSFLVSDYVQAMQYFMRFFEKNGIEDIKKGIWYMNKIVEQLEELQKKEIL